MTRMFVALALLLAGVVPAAAGAAQLSGPEMREMLTGNSIVHPDFGCAFYLADGSMHMVGQSGEKANGQWTVRGDLYYSTGQCGVAGCSLSGQFPSFTFRRTDGGYEQPVIVIRGNYCEKNGVTS